MSKVIKVITSEATASAQVTLSDGQTACFALRGPKGKDMLLEAVANGQLAHEIERNGVDTPADVLEDFAQADDWQTSYEG